MDPMNDHDAEMDNILEQLADAGMVEVYTDADGQQAMKLTPDGERVARQLAMTDEGGQDELLAGLLEGMRQDKSHGSDR